MNPAILFSLKQLSVVLLLCLWLPKAVFAGPPTDVFGWSHLKWGMTKGQVIQRVSGVEKRWENGKEVLKIPSYVIFDKKFRVSFNFDAGDRLWSVMIDRFSGGEGQQSFMNYYEPIERQLIHTLQSKYGRGKYSKNQSYDNSKEGSWELEIDWIFPSTVITYFRMHLKIDNSMFVKDAKPMNFSQMTLIYSQFDMAGEAEKL